MMFPWQRREVLMTNSAQRFGAAQCILRDAGIRYDIRVYNSGSNRGHSRSLAGSFGERTELEIFYYVYVKTAEAEKAKYLLSTAK